MQDLNTKLARVSTCKNCKNKYKSVLTEQESGHKVIEEDICPYCGYSNSSSMVWRFDNEK